MQRRKFLVGMGSLAAGSAAVTGSGAFTSNSIPDRQVDVAIDDDANSQIALIPGDDPDITLSNNPGEIQMDLTGANGEGVNINSVYNWGDPTDPSSNWAFKITNNDNTGEAYAMKATYDLDDRDSVDDGHESFIEFTMDTDQGILAQQWPDQGQNGARNNDAPLTGPGNYNNEVPQNRKLEPGESWYFAITVDTTGADADLSDNLSGALNFEFNKSSLAL